MRRILIVEDDAGIRESLTDFLTYEGFSVTSARHGRDALAVLSENSAFELILLDLMMPVMDGFEFLKNLKEQLPDTLERIKVVLLTAAGNKNLQHESVAAIHKKPIDIDELLLTIQRLLPDSAAE